MNFTDKEKSKFQEIGVTTVYLFGSRAEKTATDKSDYDFAILLKDGSRVKPDRDTHEIYQKIFEILNSMCGESVIDIVFLQAGVSLELQANVVKNGKILMDLVPGSRADYEEQVMLRMADMKPILDEMDKVILQRT